MPLSDRDLKVLADIERGLHATDPKLAASLIEHQPNSRTLRELILAISVGTVGFVLVLIGLVMNLVFVSILGYLLMVAAIVRVTSRLGMAAWISRITTTRPPSGERPQ